MSIGRTAWGHSITDSSVAPATEVGALREYLHPTYGWQIYRYIKNGSASTLAIGLGSMIKDSASDATGELSGVATAKCRMLGVAQTAHLTLYYGYVLAKGFGLSQSNGAQTVNTAQKAVAAGQFADGIIGTDELPVFAIGDDGGVAGTNVLSYIDCL